MAKITSYQLNVLTYTCKCVMAFQEMGIKTLPGLHQEPFLPWETLKMDEAERLRQCFYLAVAQNQLNLAELVRQRRTHQQRAQQMRQRRGVRRRQRAPNPRRVWTRLWLLRREQYGIYDQLLVELRREDPVEFKKFMRLPPQMFDEVLERLKPHITKQHTWYRPPLEPALKLALTLRHLASGSRYTDMQYGWRVPANTISVTVREVCRALVEEYRDELMNTPTTPDEWRQVAEQFYLRWNFPHTLGAMDGKHVGIRCPAKSGTLYYNYKGFYSIVILALVDADYKFLWVDIGGNGMASDAQIYNNCELSEVIKDGSIGFPPPDPLPNDTKNVPYFLVMDDAFRLTPNTMKPYSIRGMSDEERIYNYRLSRARRVVENAFGILANRFQVLMTTMGQVPGTVRTITTAAILLHNLMRIRFPVMQNALVDREDRQHNIIPGAWRQGHNLVDTEKVLGPNVDNKEGKKLRNLLKHWCSSEAGSVPWQDRMI